MKIFSASKIKEWDQYTITHTHISSIELMEQAATACFKWISKNVSTQKDVLIFCGKGNNGGDGLAIARLLLEANFVVHVYIPHAEKSGSPDFEINLKRLHAVTGNIHYLHSEAELPSTENNIIIDALFGTGLRSALSGIFKSIADHINNPDSKVISIDMPSGLFADSSSNGAIVKADYTLTFESYKLAFLMAENEKYFGRVVVLPIGLHKDFAEETNTSYSMITPVQIAGIFKPRNNFAHKGTFGHAAIIAGSYGMMGAAVLSVKACVSSGAGKVTATVCKQGYTIMQSAVPEAMCMISGGKSIKKIKDVESFNAIGIGPGLGQSANNNKLLKQLFEEFKKPVVIDADAINTIAAHRDLKKHLSDQTILTPHPKEFDNLFGKNINDFERLKSAMDCSAKTGAFIVLKGHHTAVVTPAGKVYFNNTGNAGMAKGGSGDVLTGILTGLLAQGYNCEQACIMGVYIHGRAGDIAAEKNSMEAMSPADIINCMGGVFKEINEIKSKLKMSYKYLEL